MAFWFFGKTTSHPEDSILKVVGVIEKMNDFSQDPLLTTIKGICQYLFLLNRSQAKVFLSYFLTTLFTFQRVKILWPKDNISTVLK